MSLAILFSFADLHHDTGLRPEVTGVYGNYFNAEAKEYSDFRKREGGQSILTLPQQLRKNGYIAYAAGKIFHGARGDWENPNPLSDPVSWDHQYRVPYGTPYATHLRDADGRVSWLQGQTESDGYPINAYLSRSGNWGALKVPKEDCGDWQIAQCGKSFLGHAHDRPFLLAVGFAKPHSPQFAPKEYFDRYPLDSISLPEVLASDMDDIPEIAKRSSFSTPFAKAVKSNPKEWKKAIQGYLAATSFADDCVGEVLMALDNSPYKDNTIIVFFSDHGWQHGQKDRWEKQALWRQATLSPMIIRLPEQQHAEVLRQNVSLLDIYPTLMSLLGITPDRELDGNDLSPLLENPEAPWDYKTVVTYGQGNHSIISGHWNYIRYRDGSEELYNFEQDPYEWFNLAQKPEYESLKHEMKQHIPEVIHEDLGDTGFHSY